VIVVAATEDTVARTRDRLRALGVTDVQVAAPSAARRLVLATVTDAWEAERIVAALRAAGELAVSRPDSGVRLEEWRRHTAPRTFAERLTLAFAWSEHDRHGLPGVIELGLGGFGSGQHPSTRLLIEELLARITGGERVLDVGCGSGVLGLGALALGASHLTAVDLKPDLWDALWNLGTKAAEQGKTQQARKALEQFAAGAPPDRYGPDIDKAKAFLRQVKP